MKDSADLNTLYIYKTLRTAGDGIEKAKQDMNIAKTIFQQLGGNKFAIMTGAKNLIAVKDGIRFNIGRNGSKANMVQITLRWDDTYTMQFWRKGSDFNPYAILMRYADKGLSEAEFNEAVKKATEKAVKNAEPKLLKEYDGIYCDQLQELFTEYTKLYTRL